MRRYPIDPDWFVVISEIMSGLSVAWYGAAFVVPTFSGRSLVENIVSLLIDIGFGTICAVVTFILKKMAKQ